MWITLPDAGGGSGATMTHSNVVEERYVLPDEVLLLQGWPVATSPVTLQSQTNSVKTSFAGNAFSGNVICSIYCSLMMAIEWAHVSEEDSDEIDDADHEEAIGLLDSLG